MPGQGRRQRRYGARDGDIEMIAVWYPAKLFGAAVVRGRDEDRAAIALSKNQSSCGRVGSVASRSGRMILSAGEIRAG